jgi:hypothetical protein
MVILPNSYQLIDLEEPPATLQVKQIQLPNFGGIT